MTLRLLRLKTDALSGEWRRSGLPPGGSIHTTSAPYPAIMPLARRPAMVDEQSTTRSPRRAPPVTPDPFRRTRGTVYAPAVVRVNNPQAAHPRPAPRRARVPP